MKGTVALEDKKGLKLAKALVPGSRKSAEDSDQDSASDWEDVMLAGASSAAIPASAKTAEPRVKNEEANIQKTQAKLSKGLGDFMRARSELKKILTNVGDDAEGMIITTKLAGSIATVDAAMEQWDEFDLKYADLADVKKHFLSDVKAITSMIITSLYLLFLRNVVGGH